MSPQICPFLGLRDDADTANEFASRGNYCYHAQPVAGVQTNHQSEFCLTARHVHCPVFQRSELQPLPEEIAFKPGLPPVVRWVAVGVLATAVLVALFAWIGLGDVLAKITQPPSAGEIDAYQRSPLMEASLTPTPTGTTDLLFAFTQSPNATLAACPPPNGWTVYVVKPTDSLLRLSIIYNLKVEDLQAANCMGETTIIRPGDRLNVPVLPTVTPSPTVTPTRRVIVLPTATEKPDDDDNPPPPPPPPTRTTAPTQRPTMTQAPPTATKSPTQPPPPTNTQPPPPTEEPEPIEDPGTGGGGEGGEEGDDSSPGLAGGLLDVIVTLLPPILD